MKTLLFMLLVLVTTISCCSQNRLHRQPFVFEEPENTAKVIETKCYNIAGEADGDYIPGEEVFLDGFSDLEALKTYYDKVGKVITRRNYHNKSIVEDKIHQHEIIEAYKYDLNNQIKSMCETFVNTIYDQNGNFMGTQIDTLSFLKFNRDTQGKLKDITGHGSMINDNTYYRANTKYEYDDSGKLIKETYGDDKHFKIFKYIQYDDYLIIYSDEYNSRFYDKTEYFGIETSTEKIYYNNQVHRKIETHYEYGKLFSIFDYTYTYDNKNRVIKQVTQKAYANIFYKQGESYEEFQQKDFPVYADAIVIHEWEYDKYGNPVNSTEYNKVPEIDAMGFVTINGKQYEYHGRYRHIPKVKLYFYKYNEQGDWYKRVIKTNTDSVMYIRNIEYK